MGAWNDSGQFLAADWDVTYNYANLTGSPFDGGLGNYGLVATVTETYSADYALNGGIFSSSTVSLGEGGVTIDIVPGGVDDVMVEIIPPRRTLVFYFEAFESNPGSVLWFQAESCEVNSPTSYTSLLGVDPALGLVLNGCEDCSGVDECGVCDGDGSTCIPGCTDATACNYSDLAGEDDGSCDYSCLGCTYPEACNYNPDATVEDGTCDYTCAGCFEQASLEEINFPIDTMVGCAFELPDYGIPPSITNNDYWVPLHVESETGQYTVLNIQVAMIQSLVVDSDGEPMTKWI